MLVLIGAAPEGEKELLGFQVGVRERTQSWRELLVDLKARALAIAPESTTGDAALSFCKAVEKLSPTTQHHAAPCTRQLTCSTNYPSPYAAKSDLHEIWAAPERATAEATVATFADRYGARYESAAILRSSTRGTSCDNGKRGVIRRICASDNQTKSLISNASK